MAYGGTGVQPGAGGLTVGGGLASSGAAVANGAQTFGWVLAALVLLILGLVALRIFLLKRSGHESGLRPGLS
ncbi:hypothetical protein [Nocardioides sp. AE5]|uniref:hypothetical protein n=1 Tax=Nocardioides sp. AE5 TaxID=2962573 RepID=UPI002882404A|nr:hypothetical protein [Nocardioides sp. AE5]MDT0203426.1 hypothetical protein [Nocardioides sp. AE5]